MTENHCPKKINALVDAAMTKAILGMPLPSMAVVDLSTTCDRICEGPKKLPLRIPFGVGTMAMKLGVSKQVCGIEGSIAPATEALDS